MAKSVTYRGAANSLRPVVYEIHNRGKTYRLRQDEPQEVPNEVADRLAQIDGHEFDIDPIEGGDD